MRVAGAVMILLFAAACGDDRGDQQPDAPVVVPMIDAPAVPDAGDGCAPGLTECTDCIDNDRDGARDGFDLECTAGYDDDESSFAVGIPDKYDFDRQDCAFDGNSGAGDDMCVRHNCCVLGISDPAMCPFNGFDPATCDDAQPATCLAVCLPLTLPGCDCFGCCTIHDPATDAARDVVIQPWIAPECDASTLLDPDACLACVKVADCAVPCGADCVLCPGQTAADLPPACAGTPACPVGLDPCTPAGGCGANQFCANGCCIDALY